MLLSIVVLSLAVSAVSSSDAKSAKNSPKIQKTPVLKKIVSDAAAIADITDAPYQVSLQQGTGHFCGGTILSNRYILTAARCVYNIPPEDSITVHAGSGDLSIDSQVARVVQINIHPDYDPANHDMDVAMLQINPLLALGELYNIEAARLRAAEPNLTDAYSVTVTGWGTTSLGLKPGLLQSSTFNLLGWDDNCESSYGNHNGDWLCASSCVGNAGDPLRGNDGEIAGYVAGIVSYEPEECGVHNAYIYTWIEGSVIRNFITDVTGL